MTTIARHELDKTCTPHTDEPWAAVVARPPWCPTPGAKAYNNQPTYYTIDLRC